MISLQATDVHIKYVLDIGSYHGQFGDTVRAVWPEAQVISIEAEEQHRSINPSQITACLGKEDNQWVEFHTLPPGSITTGASYYKELTGFYQNSVTVPLRTMTLDSLYRANSWSADWANHGLVKLDTQGSELDILSGAQSFIKEQKPRFFLLEVSHQQYNLNAPLASQTVKYMNDMGYNWIDIWEITHDSRNMLLQSDLLFERKP